jgi:hypothetical protein
MHKKLTFDVLVNGNSQTSKPATAELEIRTTEVVKVVLEELQARLTLTDSNVEITFSEEEIVE